MSHTRMSTLGPAAGPVGFPAGWVIEKPVSGRPANNSFAKRMVRKVTVKVAPLYHPYLLHMCLENSLFHLLTKSWIFLLRQPTGPTLWEIKVKPERGSFKWEQKNKRVPSVTAAKLPFGFQTQAPEAIRRFASANQIYCDQDAMAGYFRSLKLAFSLRSQKSQPMVKGVKAFFKRR